MAQSLDVNKDILYSLHLNILLKLNMLQEEISVNFFYFEVKYEDNNFAYKGLIMFNRHLALPKIRTELMFLHIKIHTD